MPNQTAKVQFNVFLENEVVDYEQVNENFEKLDAMALCIESGEKTASYSGGTSGNATWRYKKYSDGTIELYTKLEFENLKCDGGAAFPYYSGTATVMFPIQLLEVHDVQIHMASSTVGWVCDVTDKNVLDNVRFKIISTTHETTGVYKQVFVNVKGRWN